MKWKWFGLIVPVLIFLFFIIISILDVGITINENSPNTIPLDSFLLRYKDIDEFNRTCTSDYGYFSDQKGGYITIRTINIKNEFLFATQKQLRYLVCGYTADFTNNWNLNPKIFVEDIPISSHGNMINTPAGESKKVELKISVCQDVLNNWDSIYIFNLEKQPENKIYYNCQEILNEYPGEPIIIKLV